MRLAIAGLKGHQGVAVAGLPKIEGAALVAVADDTPGAAEAAAGWSVAAPDFKAYRDWRRMLDEQDLDVLVEAGVDSERADVLCAALDRGIHVLAEKPLAHDLEGLERVRAALASSTCCLSMLLTMRYDPLYRAVCAQVEEGRLGTICLASVQKSYRLGERPAWQRDRQTFSGIIPFIGIHALDLIVWTTGLKPLTGFAYQANTGHPALGDMEDNAVVGLELAGGAHACLRLDYCRPAKASTHGDDRLRIAGSQGVIEAWGATQRLTLMTDDEEPRDLPLPEAPDLFVEFAQAASEGRQAPISAADCLDRSEAVLKLRQAARERRIAQL